MSHVASHAIIMIIAVLICPTSEKKNLTTHNYVNMKNRFPT